jgi:superfamily II DNA or RNA helicase
MFVVESTTIGQGVDILLKNDAAYIVGACPVKKLEDGTKFFDAGAAAIIRERNFDAQADKNLTEALILADFEKNKAKQEAGRSMMDKDQAKALKKAKRAKKDNYVKLFDKKTQSFPIGLLDRVCDLLREDGCAFQVTDQRTKPTHRFQWNVLDGWEAKARDYQAEGCEMTDVHPRILFDWATNAGKTLLMALITQRRGVSTLLLTHSGVLARQCKRAFEEYLGYTPTVLDSATTKKAYELTPITIAVINTARNRIDELIEYGYDMIMVDEAHRSAALSYAKVVSRLKPYYIYGFSGTAYRHDGSGIVLEAQYSRVKPKVTNQEMIELGHSCPVEVEFKEVTVDVDKEDPWQLVYKNGIATNPDLNACVVMSVLEDMEKDRIVIVSVAHKAQGAIIHSMLTDFGVTCCLVDGNYSAAENDRKLQLFKAGHFQVAIGTILNEGFDFDGLDVVVNAAGMKASGVVSQKLGRVLRYREGKTGIYRDFWVHGHAILERHSRQRAEALETHGFTIDILERVRAEEEQRTEVRLAEKAKVDDKLKALMEETKKKIAAGTADKSEYNVQRFSGAAFANVGEEKSVNMDAATVNNHNQAERHRINNENLAAWRAAGSPVNRTE